MSIEINIHEIILQLVKTDRAFQEEDLSLLLPIDNVYRGFGLYSGIQKIKFDPPEEYGESYEVEVNIDDNDERISKYTSLNDM